MSDPDRAAELGEFEPAVGCLLTTGNDMQAFAELPDCPACEGTGKELPPNWRTAPAKPAPEPADGGNMRLLDIAEGIRDKARAELAEMTASRDRWHGHALDLRAELDRLVYDSQRWSRAAAEHAEERDTARTIVGQLNAELFEARAHRDMCATERDNALREVERVRRRRERLAGSDRGGQGRR